jgi:hypothetical protein
MFDQLKVVATVISGENRGEKVFYGQEKILYQSPKSQLLVENIDKIKEITKTGLMKIGEQDVFCERVEKDKKMVVCGCGHVSMPVISMAKEIGFEVTAIDDRPFFAQNARERGADVVYCEDFLTALERISGDDSTFFVIVTRGHRYDLECLEAIAKKPHAYIGMIGSKRRGKLVKQIAIENGAPKEVIEKMYTPIGLDIGGETPAEIAISILAQIIQVKSQMPQSGYTREIQKTLDGQREKMVMATIISRKGSAPRAIGTKMLIASDGKCVGTIGGGCAESEIIRKAQRMLQVDMAPCRFFVDMTGEDAEEEGMVCGGIIEVFLEKI